LVRSSLVYGEVNKLQPLLKDRQKEGARQAMHRPLTQKLQFNGERDLGYTFAVAEWNVFENTGGKATSRRPAIKPETAVIRTGDGSFPICNQALTDILGEVTKVYSLDFSWST
jgi:hypothetical protein